jgi:hypothetical protein
LEKAMIERRREGEKERRREGEKERRSNTPTLFLSYYPSL